MTNNEILKSLIGKTLIDITGAKKDWDEMVFTFDSGEKLKFYHSRSCCEHVTIEDITGELSNLLNTPLLVAEERIQDGSSKENYSSDSVTWTFYEFATRKGYVTFRWYGSSNGYYSETVDLDLY